MEEEQKTLYEAQSQQLRAELKSWESQFAKLNKGKKPTREDIKQNPDIAQKYKDYNKIRDILSGKAKPPSMSTKAAKTAKTAKKTEKQQAPTPRKRKAADGAPSSTPSKRAKPAETPSRARTYEDARTPSTASRKLFGTPTVPTSIGPTPQRDGRVLGLFDLISPKQGRTPSKRAGGAGGVEVSTPRHHQSQDGEDGESLVGGRRLARTPMSSSKRNMLNSFMTPLGKRDANANANNPGAHDANDNNNNMTKTPSSSLSPSATKLLFATPAFLRRAPPPMLPLTRVDENGELVEDDPVTRSLFAVRMPPPRRTFSRGLSSVVASLRKMEEEKLDDDLEALREMEAMEAGAGAADIGRGGGGGGIVGPPPPSKNAKVAAAAAEPGKDNVDGNVVSQSQKQANKSTNAAVLDTKHASGEPAPATETATEDILVADSQAASLLPLGGFDDEAMFDSDAEAGEGLDQHGRPLRVFKKKGQKRTTRRSNMRPVRTMRPSTTTATKPAEGEEEDGEEVVHETQYFATLTPDEEDSEPLDVGRSAASDSEFEDDGGSEYEGEGGDGGAKKSGKAKVPQQLKEKANGKGGGAVGRPRKNGKIKAQDDAGKKSKIKGKTKESKEEEEGDDDNEGDDGIGHKVGRAVKKISAAAHQNFRRLKLRNNGAKGGPGFNSRFRRRR